MITNKNDFFEQLSFIGATRKGKKSHEDVTVTLVEGKTESGKRLSVTLGNDVHVLLGDGERLKIAFFKNRMILAKGEDGMKMTAANTSHRFCRFGLSKEQADVAKSFVGDYELKYDDLYEYYFIETDAPATNGTRPQE